MVEIKKVYLQEMKNTDKVSVLCGSKGPFKLKTGKNIINIVDNKGKYLRRKIVNYTGEDSKVQKSLQDETDIKNILAKYGRTGILPIIKNEALYGDFSEVPDYQEAQNIIIKAKEQFALLNSDVRKKFENNPEKFLEFCTNPENEEEMYKLGLKIKPKATETVKVEVINQPEVKDEIPKGSN